MDYLIHHGIKGQRWGVRRFQNEDGSLKPAGEKRYNKIKEGANKVGKAYRKWLDYDNKSYGTAKSTEEALDIANERDRLLKAAHNAEDMLKRSIASKDHWWQTPTSDIDVKVDTDIKNYTRKNGNNKIKLTVTDNKTGFSYTYESEFHRFTPEQEKMGREEAHRLTGS